MSRLCVGLLGVAFFVLFPACAREREAGAERPPVQFGFGHPATAQETAAWDIDVRPDGTGLPPGSGTVAEGARLYARQCASCHGRSGREGPFDALVGSGPKDSFPFGRNPALTRTIGNYWPYATTLYDYINRAMPRPRPGSLTPDEIYSLVAWLLWRNGIIPTEAVINAQTLPGVRMPARDRFVRDNRLGGPEIR